MFQYFDLLGRSRWLHTVPYDDLYGSMALFAWLFGITYLVLEIFHRQRTVGAVVTMLLVGWVGRLERLLPSQAAAPASGARSAIRVARDTDHVGICGVCAVVRAEPGLSGAGSVAAFAGG